MAKPELTDTVALPGTQVDEMLRLAAEAEQGSEHPLDTAIVEGLRKREDWHSTRIPRKRFTAIPGRGLERLLRARGFLVELDAAERAFSCL